MNKIPVIDCQYYNKGKCRIPHYEGNIKYTSCNCEEWDCYYKRLQRLESAKLENKSLKDSIYELIQENKILSLKIKEYEDK